MHIETIKAIFVNIISKGKSSIFEGKYLWKLKMQ